MLHESLNQAEGSYRTDLVQGGQFLIDGENVQIFVPGPPPGVLQALRLFPEALAVVDCCYHVVTESGNLKVFEGTLSHGR